jgi:hypothetical protein
VGENIPRTHDRKEKSMYKELLEALERRRSNRKFLATPIASGNLPG